MVRHSVAGRPAPAPWRAGEAAGSYTRKLETLARRVSETLTRLWAVLATEATAAEFS